MQIRGQKLDEIYCELSNSLQGHLDLKAGTIAGNYNGFPYVIEHMTTFGLCIDRLIFTVKGDNAVLGKLLKNLKSRGAKSIGNVERENYEIRFCMKGTSTAKLFDSVKSCMDIITDYFRENNIVPCCKYCGEITKTHAYVISEVKPIQICDNCYRAKLNNDEINDVEEKMIVENKLLGIIGAFIGSIAGVVAILIFSSLGYVASVSGVIMAICTIKMYEKLAGKRSKFGMVASIIVMIIMTVVAQLLDWSIFFVNDFGYEYGLGVFDMFVLIPQMMFDGTISIGDFLSDLALTAIFSVGGIVSQIITMQSDKKIDFNRAGIRSIEPVSSSLL